MAVSKKTGKVAVPAGFKAISNMGGDAWKPTKAGASIQGVMGGTKTVQVERKEGKKKVKVDAHIYTIITKDGDVQVWESAGLKSLSTVKKGKQVFIQYIGQRVITKGQNPMREYLVATK